MLPLNIINEKLGRLNDWALEGNSISKDFNFSNFKESLDFVNKVGEVCDKENHVPDILIMENKVRLSLTTHEEKGLTSKDFETAEEIDKIN